MNKIRVLVVDDSVVFRTQIKAALEQSPNIEVVGTANNGRIAIQKLEQLSVDLVTLDMEMPEMDGPETIREIKRLGFPVRILIFSARTQRGSEAALNALSLGADDFLPKVEANPQLFGNPADAIAKDLIPKVMQFKDSLRPHLQTIKPATEKPLAGQSEKLKLGNFQPQAIVIGCSTGGPNALEMIFKNVKGPLRIPIMIVQHMPPVFTASLAKRISQISGIECLEARDGEDLVANRIYIAPGDFHMCLTKNFEKTRISLNKNPQRNSVRPAVDYLFETAAAIYGPSLMSFVLTGMGEDGLQGVKAVKQVKGGAVIQSKETCVVFGMPGAIFQNELQDEILDLAQIAEMISRMTK